MLSIINLDKMCSFNGSSWKQQHLAAIASIFKKVRSMLSLQTEHVLKVDSNDQQQHANALRN